MSIYKHPEYIYYEDRLRSFELWSNQIIPTKESLAKAGFWYTQIGDKVTCFCCGVSLYEWKPSDNPCLEHVKYSAQCIYLKLCGLATPPANYYAEQIPCRYAKQIFDTPR